MSVWLSLYPISVATTESSNTKPVRSGSKPKRCYTKLGRSGLKPGRSGTKPRRSDTKVTMEIWYKTREIWHGWSDPGGCFECASYVSTSRKPRKRTTKYLNTRSETGKQSSNQTSEQASQNGAKNSKLTNQVSNSNKHRYTEETEELTYKWKHSPCLASASVGAKKQIGHFRAALTGDLSSPENCLAYHWAEIPRIIQATSLTMQKWTTSDTG